ncbi:hypothetical protein KJ068_26330 [bacterium]|nr:hypothetical protein [bacterium]
MSCIYHSNAPIVGHCSDCGAGYCAECQVEVKHHGSLCLDCGAKFAQKKINQSYVAIGAGIILGLMMLSKGGVLAVIIAPYMTFSIFWGWHSAQKLWQKAGSLGSGSLASSVFTLSMRVMYAMIVGTAGGAIVQFKRHWEIVKKHQQLSMQMLPA